MKKNSGRRQAQRMFQTEKCELCNSRKNLQRHHIDQDCSNNDPKNVQVLCQLCHTRVHMALGTWGRRKKTG